MAGPRVRSMSSALDRCEALLRADQLINEWPTQKLHSCVPASSGNKYNLVDTGQKMVKWLQARESLIKRHVEMSEMRASYAGRSCLPAVCSAHQMFFNRSQTETQSSRPHWRDRSQSPQHWTVIRAAQNRGSQSHKSPEPELSRLYWKKVPP